MKSVFVLAVTHQHGRKEIKIGHKIVGKRHTTTGDKSPLRGAAVKELRSPRRKGSFPATQVKPKNVWGTGKGTYVFSLIGELLTEVRREESRRVGSMESGGE